LNPRGSDLAPPRGPPPPQPRPPESHGQKFPLYSSPRFFVFVLFPPPWKKGPRPFWGKSPPVTNHLGTDNPPPAGPSEHVFQMRAGCTKFFRHPGHPQPPPGPCGVARKKIPKLKPFPLLGPLFLPPEPPPRRGTFWPPCLLMCSGASIAGPKRDVAPGYCPPHLETPRNISCFAPRVFFELCVKKGSFFFHGPRRTGLGVLGGVGKFSMFVLGCPPTFNPPVPPCPPPFVSAKVWEEGKRG